MQEDPQDTRESDALVGEVSFDREDVEAVGDPAAASVDPDPVVSQGAETPVEAQQRGSELAEGPPFGPIAGAFVGAFVAAKLLGKLGGDD
ncbi:MAG: hypothetical protein QOG41_2589 [Thermoleophilaceae bacterium]|nr:hypothetical protein [Thermoleophilaceae bacterium]MEA2389816.1 hypothetical protein [Thermoleophilaceae bacterium]